MNCKSNSSFLMDYIENKLDQNRFEQVKSHLEQCPKCSQAFAFLSKSMGSVSHFKDSTPQVSDFFTERMLSKFQNLSGTTYSPTTWMISVLFRKTSVVAASVAALFAGVIFGILLNLNTAKLHENDITSDLQTVEEVYLAGTSNDYMIQFFDNQYYNENGNE